MEATIVGATGGRAPAIALASVEGAAVEATTVGATGGTKLVLSSECPSALGSEVEVAWEATTVATCVTKLVLGRASARPLASVQVAAV